MGRGGGGGIIVGRGGGGGIIVGRGGGGGFQATQPWYEYNLP